MKLLYDSEQNVIAPTEIQTRLAQIDPRLSLRYVKYNHPGDPSGRDKHHWWALTVEWPEADSRRKMIQRGDMPEEYAFDIIGYLPIDVEVVDCYDRVTDILKRQEKHPHVAAGELLARVHEFNTKIQKENLKPTVELATELIETNAKTMFREQGKEIPKVFVTDAKHKGR